MNTQSTSRLLDFLYQVIDDMLSHGDFEWCDKLMQHTDVSICHIDTMIAILTATLPAKSKLSSRDIFFKKVQVELIKREEDDIEGSLSGLD